MNLTRDIIARNESVHAFLKTADNNFAAVGYKEHGLRHAKLTATIAGNILKFLEYDEREVELAWIAGYLHDIGNAVARRDHSQTGAVLVLDILQDMQISYQDIFPIISAIGGHEDRGVAPPSAVAAAVVLADKTDVHRTRVRSEDISSLDVHARVNYACQRAFMRVHKDTRVIALELTIDTAICAVMDYFEIFLSRIKFCQKASKTLGCTFEISINNDKFL
ncbi:MAG: HD domain-containing protein [Elusimicrobia bacterium]|nr:HD domain-containing protein [Elusimicrobiota bacterium]